MPPKVNQQMKKEFEAKHPGVSIPGRFWALSAFHTFEGRLNHLRQITHMSTRGIAMLPRTVEALEQFQETMGIEKTDFSDAQAAIELAESEIANDFPLIHANGAIFLWSLLEALVRTLIVELLRNEPNAWQVKEVQQLKIRLGDYEPMSEDERYFYVAESLEKELGSSLRGGCTRFEALLKPFNLSETVPEELGRTIWELSQVRNSIIHRGGFADNRLIQACPWLNLNHGDEIKISHKTFGRYLHAAAEYMLLLMHRMAGPGLQISIDDDLEEAVTK